MQDTSYNLMQSIRARQARWAAYRDKQVQCKHRYYQELFSMQAYVPQQEQRKQQEGK